MAQGVETQLICDFCSIHGIWQILESETETDTTTYLTIYIHTACPHHWGFPIVPELIFLEPESIIPACTEILHFSWDLLQIRCWEHHDLLLLTKIRQLHIIRSERPSAGGQICSTHQWQTSTTTAGNEFSKSSESPSSPKIACFHLCHLEDEAKTYKLDRGTFSVL